MPRSIVAWFGVCWGLFLVAALIVGTMLVALYKETTTQRIDRATVSLARACDAIVREFQPSDMTPDGGVAAVSRALVLYAGVEGGVWKTGVGSVAYAFPRGLRHYPPDPPGTIFSPNFISTTSTVRSISALGMLN